MKRFRVTETRSFTNVYIIDAEDDAAAESGAGEIIEEAPDADSITQSIDRVEEIGAEDTL